MAKPKTLTDFDKELFQTFRRVEVNNLLLDAIKHILKYAKFLRKLCTNKRRLKDDERINMGRNVSALIQPNMLQKCKDLDTFTILCTIGNSTFSNAFLDLGASINAMPTSIYKSFNLVLLKQIGVVIQLKNRSTAVPAGVVKDVLVIVDRLIFLAEFYILDMAEDSSMPTLILGRPFLKTVSSCTCTITDLCKVCIEIDAYLTINDVSYAEAIHAAELDSSTRTFPSIVQPPILELNPFPKHMKYVILESGNNC
ncbi:uncharacterized protein LOC113862338 [Abrus precatorius]|uniref:Uncharacterized protein LOC113862338 n=1 Tax=Abrus precatorius TaxID=3816 RepID=A0A8B8L910_ABRPR|nr:uncharacterized protein LOC113862338 [Abrus precatorius]